MTLASARMSSPAAAAAPAGSPPQRSPLRAHWQRLAAREQTLVLLAAAVIGLALLWWLLLAPALHTLKTSAARHAAVDAQLRQMQQWQAEAQQLQDAPRTPALDAPAQLQRSVQQLPGGSARVVIAGDQATVTLQAVPAEALAQWLAQLRTSAHAVPQQAHLKRSPASAAPTWDGTLVLTLPPD